MACMHNHQSLISTTLACHVMPTYTLHRISPCSMHWTLSNVKFPHNPLTPPQRVPNHVPFSRQLHQQNQQIN